MTGTPQPRQGGFEVGAVYGVADLTTADPAVQMAAHLVQAARMSDPRPDVDRFGDILGESPFRDAAEAASAQVHAAAEQRWGARALIRDAWAGRLWAPPIQAPPAARDSARAILTGGPLPQPVLPRWSIDALIMEINAIGAIAAADREAVAGFRRTAAVQVQRVIQSGGADHVVHAALAAIRTAATAAVTAMAGN